MSGLPTLRTTLAASMQDVWRVWRARQPRERYLLGIGAVILMLLLIWLLLIDPALTARSRWQQTLPVWRSQLAHLRALAAEMAALPPPAASSMPAVELSRAVLERSLHDKGLQAEYLTFSENRVSTQFSNVPFAALAEWLQQMQLSAGLIVNESNIVMRDLPGRVDAQLTLQRVQ